MDNSFNPNIVRVFCRDCCDNGISLFLEMEWDESPNVYLSFLANARNLSSPWRLIKERFAAAWAMLRGRDFCTHDVILDTETWHKFYEKMTEFNSKIKEKENNK